MGIIDTIKQFFQTRETSKEADTAIASVKKAAGNNNYNQASIKAFYALEKIGSVFAEKRREDYETAREYANKLVNDGLTTQEEVEPIILNFELAKYSEIQVTFDDYSKVEQSLESVAQKFKSGSAQSTAKKARSKSRRRKPRKGGKTGAAKTRKRRTRKSSK